MTSEEIKKYFGSTYRFAKETGMSTGNWHFWAKNGYVPVPAQVFLHRFTKGKLKIDLDLISDEESTNARG